MIRRLFFVSLRVSHRVAAVREYNIWDVNCSLFQGADVPARMATRQPSKERKQQNTQTTPSRQAGMRSNRLSESSRANCWAVLTGIQQW